MSRPTESSPEGRSDAPPALPRRWLEAALRLRLFWKILLANAALVALAVVAGAVLRDDAVAVPVGVAAVALTVFVNAFILRLALRPVQGLVATAAAVKAGRLDARAPRSTLADPDLARVIDALNEVLESATEYRGRLRALLSRLVREEEEERKRVALLLHDDTAQRLAALLLRMGGAGTRSPEEISALLEEARIEVAGALDVVRRYAPGRYPMALNDLGLASASESYARSVLGDGVALTMRVGDGDLALSADVELALYRILQEALDNVAAHAGARRVEVAVEDAGGTVRVRVEDDGRGFGVEEARRRGALGLFEMEERAAAVKGRVEVSSSPGGGTRVTAEIPIRTGA